MKKCIGIPSAQTRAMHPPPLGSLLGTAELQPKAVLHARLQSSIGHVSAEFDLTQEYQNRLIAFFTQALSQ